MENNKKYETIHRFLLDEMDLNEKTAFEKEMASSDDVKKNVEMEKRFLKIVNYASDADLKNTISAVHKDLSGKGFFENQQTDGAKIIQLKDRKYSRYLIAVAAVVAILIVSWFALNWNNGTSVDTEAIFANNYKPENKLIETYLLPSAGVVENDFRIALDQYAQREYMEVVKLLVPLHKQTPENDAVTFYLALSYLGLEDVKGTINLLAPLSKKESALKAAANWYLGLAYLKNKEQKEAVSVFEKLSKGADEEYSRKASLLLQELK